MDTKLNKLLTQVDDMEEMLQLMQRSHEMMLGQFKVKLEDLKQQVETLKNEANDVSAKPEHQPEPEPELQPVPPAFVEKEQPSPIKVASEPAPKPSPEPARDAEPEPMHAPEPARDAEPAPKPVRDIMSTFTINDRFLFLRELFDGDDQRFNETIDSIQQMANMNQVENYIADVLDWDHSNEVVKEFTRLVSLSFD